MERKNGDSSKQTHSNSQTRSSQSSQATTRDYLNGPQGAPGKYMQLLNAQENQSRTQTNKQTGLGRSKGNS